MPSVVGLLGVLGGVGRLWVREVVFLVELLYA